MTVKQLREKLSKLDENTRVVVYLEEDTDHQCFEIEEVEEKKAVSSRNDDGKVRFLFDSKALGATEWVLVTIAPA